MSISKPVYILAIESSCDETSAAVSYNDQVLSNIVAGQKVHEKFGGVVPELASRAHQQNIIPVVHQALSEANVSKNQLNAVAYTSGPGLLGSLLVGGSFAKSFAQSLQLPLIEVNHMQAHILAHFIKSDSSQAVPDFPFLCLTVSGGHTQIVKVEDHLSMHIIGETLDDAAGEAFDKAAKILGLPYPGGPLIDKYAALGNNKAFTFPHPVIPEFNYSFSGLKTAFMNFVNKNTAEDSEFVKNNLNDICASIQFTIVEVLLRKFEKAIDTHNIKTIAVAGGVSANSGLRNALKHLAERKGLKLFVPPFQYCTDNAGMIAAAALFKYLAGDFSSLDAPPLARYLF